MIEFENSQPISDDNDAARVQAENDNLQSIELPDTGPSHPNWLYPEVVESLLVLGDEWERELVGRLLHVSYEALGCLERAVHCEEASIAKSHFEDALVLVRAFANSANNLNAYHTKGLQHVTRIVVKGPTLGLGAKIQQSLNPAKDSPEAKLVEEVRHVASIFENASERFLKEARLIERAEYGPADYDYAKWRGAYLQTLKDAKGFRTLAARALAAAIELDEAVIDLTRGRRQTIVVEDPTAPVIPISDEKSEPTVKRRDAA